MNVFSFKNMFAVVIAISGIVLFETEKEAKYYDFETSAVLQCQAENGTWVRDERKAGCE